MPFNTKKVRLKPRGVALEAVQLLPFNTKKVRLKLEMRKPHVMQRPLFQYQKGAIKTPRPSKSRISFWKTL